MLGSDSIRKSRRPEPVVLLHGLLRTRRSMTTAARWLSKSGFEPHLISYPSTRSSMEELAVLVDTEVQSRFNEDERRVHFLTHSMGGIVLRQILARQASLSESSGWKIGRVVMLAAPNQGSRVAESLGDRRLFRWLFGEAGQELRGRSGCCLPILPVPKETGLIAGNRSVGVYRKVVRQAATRGLANDGTVGVDEVAINGLPMVQVASGHTFIMNSREALEHAATFFRTGKFQIVSAE